MDSLNKSQKDEYATSYAILALFDGGAEITSDQVNTLLQATGNTEVEAFYPIIFSNYLSNPETLGKLIAIPGSGSGGGGGGGGGGDGAGDGDGGAQEEAKEEVKEEDEEMDMAGGIDMFGGDDEGGGGDY